MSNIKIEKNDLGNFHYYIFNNGELKVQLFDNSDQFIIESNEDKLLNRKQQTNFFWGEDEYVFYKDNDSYKNTSETLKDILDCLIKLQERK